jgi:hypothetical protein
LPASRAAKYSEKLAGFFEFMLDRFLPDLVRGPVDFSHGFTRRINSACLPLSSTVQTLTI